MSTKPRNAVIVIQKMLDLVPQTETKFRNALEWNREDAQYKAPEETIHWTRTQQTLEKHIPDPVHEW